MPLSILNLKLHNCNGKETKERKEIQMQKESEHLVFSLVFSVKKHFLRTADPQQDCDTV